MSVWCPKYIWMTGMWFVDFTHAKYHEDKELATLEHAKQWTSAWYYTVNNL